MVVPQEDSIPVLQLGPLGDTPPVDECPRRWCRCDEDASTVHLHHTVLRVDAEPLQLDVGGVLRIGSTNQSPLLLTQEMEGDQETTFSFR